MGKLISLLKERGMLPWVLGLFIIGVVLILISSVGDGGSAEADGTELSLTEYKERLESEIADLCSDVDGVGKCRVFITFERGAQSSYKGSTLIETKPPKILGITVVCRGADSDAVRRDITDMLTSLFDIGSNRIAVLKLN